MKQNQKQTLAQRERVTLLALIFFSACLVSTAVIIIVAAQYSAILGLLAIAVSVAFWAYIVMHTRAEW